MSELFLGGKFLRRGSYFFNSDLSIPFSIFSIFSDFYCPSARRTRSLHHSRILCRCGGLQQFHPKSPGAESLSRQIVRGFLALLHHRGAQKSLQLGNWSRSSHLWGGSLAKQSLRMTIVKKSSRSSGRTLASFKRFLSSRSLKESAPRSGFAEEAAYDRLAKNGLELRLRRTARDGLRSRLPQG